MSLFSPRVLAPLWSILILIGLSLPGSSLPDSSLLEFDKVIHFILFFVLTILWLSAISHGKVGPGLAVLTFMLAFSVLSELYQEWLPFGRTADLMDSAADAFGAMSGFLLWLPLRHHLLSWSERSRTQSVQKR